MTNKFPSAPDTITDASDMFIEYLLKGYQVCDDLDVDESELEEFLQALAKKSGTYLASKFIFTMHREDDEISVAVTPKAYFDQNGCLYDQHLWHIYDLMPPFFDEVMEATWVAEGYTNLKEVYDAMSSHGFEWSIDAQKFVDGNSTHPLAGEINQFAPPQRPATTGDFKKIFADSIGGKPSDYVRLSKFTDSQGNTVREFKYKISGIFLKATVRKDGGHFYGGMPEEALSPAAKKKLSK